MRSRLALALVFLPLGACLSAQPDTPPAPGKALAGSTWILTELNGEPVSLGAGQRAPMFAIEAGTDRFRGYAGCNQMSGSVTRNEPGGIQFKNVISTKMACANLDLETRFLAALTAARSYSMGGETLDLFDAAHTRVARLTAAP